MPKPYEQDLRDRVLAAYDRGKQTKEIAGTFGVSPAWARRVKQVRREEQRTTRLPMGGVRVVKVDLARLRELVEQQPDATIPRTAPPPGQRPLQRVGGGHGPAAPGALF